MNRIASIGHQLPTIAHLFPNFPTLRFGREYSNHIAGITQIGRER